MRALEKILRGLTPDFPLPIAVVQHRSAEWDGQQSQLTRLLQLHSPLPLVEASDKDPIGGGRVYLAPPDYHLLVDDGCLALSTDARVCQRGRRSTCSSSRRPTRYREGRARR